MNATATDPRYFERMYAADPDPWRFGSSEYEARKYAATVAALPGERFGRGLEVGCSIGVLSRALAGRCDRFLGMDVAEAAVAQARERCADLPGAAFAAGRVPENWPNGGPHGGPDGGFDLMVFSEVLYYLGDDGLRRTAELAAGGLLPGGGVVLVNWLGDTGAGMSGEDAAERFIAAAAGLVPVRRERAELYRLDVLRAG